MKRRRVVVALIVLAGAGAAWKTAEEGLVRREAAATRRYIAERDYEHARDSLGRWLAARPRSAEAAVESARLAFATGAFAEGFAALDRAAAEGLPRDRVDRLRAVALARAGRHEEALPVLQRLFLASDAPDPELDEALARGLIETYQFKAAETVVDRWLLDAPGDPKATLWKAEVDRRLDAPAERLIDDYRRVLDRDPSSSEAHYRLGDLYLGLHRLSEARSEFEQALAARPADALVHLGLGRCFAEQGDDEAAARALDRAAELAPTDVRILVERARLELRAGRPEPALGWIDRAIAADRDDPESYFIKTNILVRLGRNEDAATERIRAARLRKDKGELAAIIDSLNRSPRDVELQFRAAQWLFAHDHPEEALRWAEKILRQAPKHAATNQLLADYYRRTGDVGLANYYEIQSNPETKRP